MNWDIETSLDFGGFLPVYFAPRQSLWTLGQRDSKEHTASILEKFNQILCSLPSRIGTMQEKSRIKATYGAGGAPKRFRGPNLLVDGA